MGDTGRRSGAFTSTMVSSSASCAVYEKSTRTMLLRGDGGGPSRGVDVSSSPLLFQSSSS